MSILSNIYDTVYNSICGSHPYLRLWHFQWLAVKDLHRDLREVLNDSGGKILDVGCGKKPYRAWFKFTDEYVGVDIYKGPEVDIIIEPNKKWPLKSNYYDVVLCTQVLEHSSDFENVCNEIFRVLKPGGKFILSVPFCYNEHGVPDDFRRLSVHGINLLFSQNYQILRLRSQGGIGSTVGLLTLNWIESSMNRNLFSRLCKGFLMPVWILLSLLINTICLLMDGIDFTGSFYSNVFLVAQKP